MKKLIPTLVIAGLVLLIGPSMGFTLRGAGSLSKETSSLVGFLLLGAAGVIAVIEGVKNNKEEE